MLYDRISLADLLRRADRSSCRSDCSVHGDVADRIAAHALHEIETDIGYWVAEAVNEASAGADL